jgi:hypothetical protein
MRESEIMGYGFDTNDYHFGKGAYNVQMYSGYTAPCSDGNKPWSYVNDYFEPELQKKVADRVVESRRAGSIGPVSQPYYNWNTPLFNRRLTEGFSASTFNPLTVLIFIILLIILATLVRDIFTINVYIAKPMGNPPSG